MTVNVQADLESLYKAIMAKVSGRQVSQAGHKDKQTSFAGVPLSEMLRLYRQLWTKASGLPDLKDLDAAAVRRGPPTRAVIGGWR